MRIYELFDELQEEVKNARGSVFGGKKIEADVVDDILADMREALPEDIEKARQIVEREEEILTKAREKAQSVLEGVDTKLAEMIEDNKVTQLAYEKSNRLIDIANKQAIELRTGANAYAVDVLEDLLSYLKEYIDIVNENKSNFLSRQNNSIDQSSF